MNYELSRRLFLKSALSAIAIAACSSQREPEPEQNPQNPDEEAIFRAGSLLLISSEKKVAQAFLMEEWGQYAFYTIGHAADALFEDRDNVSITSSGLFKAQLDPRMFIYGSTENDIELSAGHLVDFLRNEQDILTIHQLIEEKKLVPLVPAQRPPVKDERIAIPDPDSGNLTIMQVVQYDQSENMFSIVSNGKRVICKGRSGAPVLRYNGNSLTNEVYGIVAEAFLGHPTENCGFRALFRPINIQTIPQP